MDVTTANRLYEYRKKNHLSQEELAEKLGVSRQAVSKWERAEASPDTDNLINLSKLYGVSLDTLINVDPETDTHDGGVKEEKPDDENQEEASSNGDSKINIEKDGIHIEDGADKVHVSWKGVHIEDGSDSIHVGWNGINIKENGKQIIGSDDFTKKRLLQDFPISLIVCAAYIIMGVFWGLWHPGWIVFFLIPVLHSLISAIYKKNARVFAYPVFITALYLLLGCVWGLWHPYWVLFLTIPLYYAIVNWIRK